MNEPLKAAYSNYLSGLFNGKRIAEKRRTPYPIQYNFRIVSLTLEHATFVNGKRKAGDSSATDNGKRKNKKMQLLKTHYHPDIKSLDKKTIFTRLATRSIAIQGNDILLMYTARYEDYSLPGGGLDLNEDKIEGMKRELIEETGASNISNIQPFGIYEEYRPWYKPDYDIQHMISYCYTCDINKELGTPTLESYEIKNGMKPLWINIHDAIQHNKKTIASSEKKGMSIERETFLLMKIVERRII